jgi:3-oxoacyl-[acyl-carrier-protein] synthase II
VLRDDTDHWPTVPSMHIEKSSRRRVVVTGIGVVSTAGIGRTAFFDGICGRAPLLAGIGTTREIANWDPSAQYANPKELRRADRSEQLAIVAAAEALEHAGGLSSAPERTGVVLGVGFGGLRTYEEQLAIRAERGDRAISPLTVPMVMPNAAASAISRRYGTTGPCETTAVACAAAGHAIGNAYRMISWGICDTVITGGTESAGAPGAIAAFTRMTALSASGVSRPFDRNRDGFVLSEGAGILVLEELEHARARGASILAEVVGFAANADAHHISAPSPGGQGAIACMRAALLDAGLAPEEILSVNAHGTSTALNDETEAAAIADVFGAGSVPVTSTKGATGHPLGSAGALEAVSVVLSFTERLIPPTLNTLDVPEEFRIDVVKNQARPWVPGATISNNFAFGGHNVSLVLRPL